MRKKHSPIEMQWRTLLVGSGVLVALLSMLSAWALRQIDLERVRVSGQTYLTEGEVRAQAAVDTTKKLFELAELDIEQRVERHPWVAEASVTRWINGVLEITIRERQPLLLALNEEGRVYAYLDHEGHVMPWRPGVSATVPLYRGPLPDSLPASLRMLLHVLNEDVEARHLLAEVEMTPSGELTVQTIPTDRQSGVPVRLGKQGIPEKWRKLKAFWKQVVMKHPDRFFERVDLRFAHQIVTRERTLNPGKYDG